jgi:hypothetical protein
MKTLGALVLAMTVILALEPGGGCAPVAAAIVPSGFDERIRLDWEAGTTRSGKPLIRGYVLNDYAQPANNVLLLVETLDGSGQVVARTVGFVFGLVQGNSRAYFEVPLKAAGASYRVTVTALDWRAGGGGGGM